MWIVLRFIKVWKMRVKTGNVCEEECGSNLCCLFLCWAMGGLFNWNGSDAFCATCCDCSRVMIHWCSQETAQPPCFIPSSRRLPGFKGEPGTRVIHLLYQPFDLPGLMGKLQLRALLGRSSAVDGMEKMGHDEGSRWTTFVMGNEHNRLRKVKSGNQKISANRCIFKLMMPLQLSIWSSV